MTRQSVQRNEVFPWSSRYHSRRLKRKCPQDGFHITLMVGSLQRDIQPRGGVATGDGSCGSHLREEPDRFYSSISSSRCSCDPGFSC
jgi:hypothetical protein